MWRRRAFGSRLLRTLRCASPTVPSTYCKKPFSLSSSAQAQGYHPSSFYLQFALCGPAAVLLLSANANPVLAKDASTESNLQNPAAADDLTGLRRIEDGSVVSNIHTSKWRVFTDQGRDLFLQRKLDEAEKYFLLALQEAKQGFGERDSHVASSCNNLAELYRIRREFHKAEPLYMDSINILEETFGPEDIRVGVACHNLGQFFLVQRKLDEARVSYECALKIKGRVLGQGNPDFADTMYHLGTVLHVLGKEKDAEALIQDSIRILEDGGSGESPLCIRRLRYLAQIYLKSNRTSEAENVQRKILHILELSKGWSSLDTVMAAEELALTVQSLENFQEAQEFLQRCLDVRIKLLPKDHIQIGANMLHLAKVAMHNSKQARKIDISFAYAELDKAKDLLGNSIRIAQLVLNATAEPKDKLRTSGAYVENRKDRGAALKILLQSLDALGVLEISKQGLQDSKEPGFFAEKSLRQCISAYKEFGDGSSLGDSPEVKAEYVMCMKHLLNLLSDSVGSGRKETGKEAAVQELKDEIKSKEAEILQSRRRWSMSLWSKSGEIDTSFRGPK